MDNEKGTIVVGVDGEAAGRQALVWAIREGRVRGCEVQAVNVWDYDPVRDVMDVSSGDLQKRSTQVLEREVAQATAAVPGSPPIGTASLEGHPAKTLVEAASDAAMLVVGRHRGGLVRDAFLGSVSSSCVRHAKCPVVVIPADPE